MVVNKRRDVENGLRTLLREAGLVPRHSDFDRLSEGGTNLPMGRGTYPDGLVRIFARIDFKRVEITVQRY